MQSVYKEHHRERIPPRPEHPAAYRRTPAYPQAPQYDPNATQTPYDAFAPAPARGSKIAAVSLGFGVAALVSSVIGYVWAFIGLSVALRALLAPLFAWSVYAAVAVALGHVALNAIRDARGSTGGRGIALAGLILGYIGLALWLVNVVSSYLTFRGRGI